MYVCNEDKQRWRDGIKGEECVTGWIFRMGKKDA